MISKAFLSSLWAGLLWLRLSDAQSAASKPTVTLDSGVVFGTAVSIPIDSSVGLIPRDHVTIRNATEADIANSTVIKRDANGTALLAADPVVVNEYLGIPFAQSPPLRFAPPAPAKPWTSPLDATAYKPICVEEFMDPELSRNFTMAVFGNPGGPPLPESEDCLYINVFAPATRSPVGGRTVMVWIYGGALEFGGSSDLGYNGTSFAANQDVVLVTFNYRTNVFGFSSSPEIAPDQQNVGFLDQRFALQWVQDNIVSFGGSPDKVTIFGESAGGFSVKQLVALPPNLLPFRAAILESEATETSPTGPSAWASLVSALNCTNSTSELACVRAAPAATIKSIEEEQMLFFNPTFDNVTAVSDTTPIFSSGGGSHVPFLIGTNANEGTPFAYQPLAANPNITVDEYVASIIPAEASALRQQIVDAYPLSTYGTPFFAIAQIITDLEFLCPAAQVANLAVSSGKYDVWRYYFNATFPNTQTFPNAEVYHSSEIPLVFGTYPAAGATDQEMALSQSMQTAWANFAKDPSTGPGWPKIGSNGGVELGALGANGTDGETTISLSTVDSICSIYAGLLTVTGV